MFETSYNQFKSSYQNSQDSLQTNPLHDWSPELKEANHMHSLHTGVWVYDYELSNFASNIGITKFGKSREKYSDYKFQPIRFSDTDSLFLAINRVLL